MLPPEVRDELERRIVERAFSGYEELAGWLQAQGYEIAKNSVQRYGTRLHRKIEAFEQSARQAKAIVQATSKARVTVVDAAIDLLNDRVFSALMEAEQIEQGDIVRLSRALADLSRITLARQRWTEEMRSRVEQQKQAERERRARAPINEALAALSAELLSKALKLGATELQPADPDARSIAKFDTGDADAVERGKPHVDRQ